jgi:hypothetical protein
MDDLIAQVCRDVAASRVDSQLQSSMSMALDDGVEQFQDDSSTTLAEPYLYFR